MSAKIIFLADLRPKEGNLPDGQPDPLEMEGDELAVFVLRGDGGSIWLSVDLRSRERLNYVLDFLDRAKDKIRQLTVEMDS
jgi:hypothetical protein